LTWSRWPSLIRKTTCIVVGVHPTHSRTPSSPMHRVSADRRLSRRPDRGRDALHATADLENRRLPATEVGAALRRGVQRNVSTADRSAALALCSPARGIVVLREVAMGSRWSRVGGSVAAAAIVPGDQSRPSTGPWRLPRRRFPRRRRAV
jgi:hypothetical protein